MKQSDIDERIKEVEQGRISELAWQELEGRFDKIEQNLHMHWGNSEPNEQHNRELFWLQLNALKQLRQSFEMDIDSATMAQMQLNEDREQRTK